jgi:Family of unknown function (DUF5636)
MACITDVTDEYVVNFLVANFAPDNIAIPQKKEDYMLRYAKMARFLSDKSAFGKVAGQMSAGLAELYRYYKDEQRLRGAFSEVLRLMAPVYGFSDRILILNGQLSHNEFCSVVRGKHLFRDVYTRPHGEYTHTIQWIILAAQFGSDVPHLYEYSVGFKSKQKFASDRGEDQIYMWNFLVDCFDGSEDFEKNINCKTFRCPQIVTESLRKVLPSDTWLGEYLYNRRQKGLKQGQPVDPSSHYAKKRETTMSSSEIGREIDNQKVYKQISQNVWEKVILDEMLPRNVQKNW